MFEILRKNHMRVVQGDSAAFDIDIENYNFVDGDKIYFTVKKKTKRKNARRLLNLSLNFSMATAAGFTISRTFFRALPRGGIHRARIIAFRLTAAIGTRHFVRVHFHQLFKTLSASGTFILQKRHTCHPTTKLPFYYTRKNAF